MLGFGSPIPTWISPDSVRISYVSGLFTLLADLDRFDVPHTARTFVLSAPGNESRLATALRDTVQRAIFQPVINPLVSARTRESLFHHKSFVGKIGTKNAQIPTVLSTPIFDVFPCRLCSNARVDMENIATEGPVFGCHQT